jgi:hypothetical protein
LARFHQVAIEAPEDQALLLRTTGSLSMRRLTEQLAGRLVGLGQARGTGIGQGAGGPETHGGDVVLEGPDQGVITGASG